MQTWNQQTYRLITAGAALLAVALSLPSPASLAQSPSELDRLIFEPAVLSTGNVLENSVVLFPNGTPLTAYGNPVAGGRPARPRGGKTRDDAMARYRDTIRALETEGGPYTEQLFEILQSLADLYQEEGDHSRGIETFARAQQVSRVNLGLNNLAQVESIEGMIESLIALGDLASVGEKYRFLVYLHERHHGADDPRVVPALLALADWNMAGFQRGVRYELGKKPNAAVETGATSVQEMRALAFGMLFQAQTAYLRAIRILVKNRLLQDPRLPALERNLIETYFLQAFQKNLVEQPNNYFSVSAAATGTRISKPVRPSGGDLYDLGVAAYKRMLIYLRDNPQIPVHELALAVIELGDWHLLFGRSRPAAREYREAWQMMEAAGISREDLDEILKPAVPVALPTFTPTPHSRRIFQIPDEAPVTYQGHVDLSFKLYARGNAGKISIIGQSPQTTREIEHRLISTVSSAQFRPRLEGGEPINGDEIALRYYYGFSESPPFSGNVVPIALSTE